LRNAGQSGDLANLASQSEKPIYCKAYQKDDCLYLLSPSEDSIESIFV
jgi:hypothetical protein